MAVVRTDRKVGKRLAEEAAHMEVEASKGKAVVRTAAEAVWAGWAGVDPTHVAVGIVEVAGLVAGRTFVVPLKL